MLRVIGNDQSLPRQEHAVASGTLTNGTPVIVNSDGTVSVVEETSDSAGSSSVFESAQVSFTGTTFDSSNNKIVVAYRDVGNSEYATAAVGTVSGTSINFGTPVVIQSHNTTHLSAAFDTTNNKVIVFGGSDVGVGYYQGTAWVGTVSGTSITFGSGNIVNTANTVYNNVIYDSGSDKLVFIYKDQGNSGYGTGRVGSLSGTSISFGSEVVFASHNTNFIKASYDVSNNKTVVVWRNGSDSNKGYAMIGSVSGTTISFANATNFSNVNSTHISIAYDSTLQKHLIAYSDEDNSGYGKAIVGTVSGGSITFGSIAVFEQADSEDITIIYDTSRNKFLVSYIDKGNSNKLTGIVATISSTSVSFGTSFIIADTAIDHISAAFDSNSNKIIVNYEDEGNSSYGTSSVVTIGSINITSENYIGIARSGAASGAGAIIDTQGAIADIPVINYVLSSAAYDSKSFSTASQDVTMKAMAFNTDGTKMYLVGTTGDAIYQYSLSTAFDVSTASYDSVSFSVSSQSVFPSAVEFNNDGTKMYVGSSNTNGVFQYSLSSAFDLSTASYDSVSFDPSTQETSVQGIQFNNDGTKLYIIGTQSDAVFQYSLSTGFNLSTTSYDSVSFSVASQSTNSHGLEFNNDGTKLFVCDVDTDTIYQYDLTTGFDLSTASYSNISFDVSSQDAYPAGMSFNSDGSKMYIVGDDSNYIYQYSTAGSSLTAGQSYYVQTDGTLGTTADDPSVFAGTAVSATELIVKG